MLNKLKNDGAWYRANEWIRKQAGATAFSQAFQSVLAADTQGKFASYVTALGEIRTAAGIQGAALNLTVAALSATYATQGIPREVWFGYLTFDTYQKRQVNGKDVYVPDHQQQARDMGVFIRDTFRTVRLTVREMLDIQNITGSIEGNPGGVADANKQTK